MSQFFFLFVIYFIYLWLKELKYKTQLNSGGGGGLEEIKMRHVFTLFLFTGKLLQPTVQCNTLSVRHTLRGQWYTGPIWNPRLWIKESSVRFHKAIYSSYLL